MQTLVLSLFSHCSGVQLASHTQVATEHTLSRAVLIPLLVSLPAQAHGEFGRLDILVNNAGAHTGHLTKGT